ncbi:unnamed protein product, partial [Urochloa humidicola]
HKNCNHWYLAVINTKKQEIHVLDSLGKQHQERGELKYTLKQIQQCLELASSEVQSINWPDYEVANWNVTQESRIPKQTDMSSCGLFMIKYMEYWTGEKLSKEFTQGWQVNVAAWELAHSEKAGKWQRRDAIMPVNCYLGIGPQRKGWQRRDSQ